MKKLIKLYENDIETLNKVLTKLEGTGMAWGLVNGMKNGLRMVVDDLYKCVRGENVDTGDRQLTIPDVMISLSDTMKFIDWVSDKSYKRCINGEWIQIGTGDYKTVARNTIELYEIFKSNYR